MIYVCVQGRGKKCMIVFLVFSLLLLSKKCWTKIQFTFGLHVICKLFKQKLLLQLVLFFGIPPSLFPTKFAWNSAHSLHHIWLFVIPFSAFAIYSHENFMWNCVSTSLVTVYWIVNLWFIQNVDSMLFLVCMGILFCS